MSSQCRGVAKLARHDAKNRYGSHAHILAQQFRQQLRLFALDREATKVAALTVPNRNTVNRYVALERHDKYLATLVDVFNTSSTCAAAIPATHAGTHLPL